METSIVIDIAREAIFISGLVAAPLLVVGTIVGLSVALLQAVTQIHDQTVLFVPKLVAMILTLLIALPWLLGRLLQYTADLYTTIPTRL
jgi:flagellar biosynthetic protein FliQ